MFFCNKINFTLLHFPAADLLGPLCHHIPSTCTSTDMPCMPFLRMEIQGSNTRRRRFSEAVMLCKFLFLAIDHVISKLHFQRLLCMCKAVPGLQIFTGQHRRVVWLHGKGRNVLFAGTFRKGLIKEKCIFSAWNSFRTFSPSACYNTEQKCARWRSLCAICPAQYNLLSNPSPQTKHHPSSLAGVIHWSTGCTHARGRVQDR